MDDDPVFLKDLLNVTLGVMVDDVNDVVLLIGPDGAVRVGLDDDGSPQIEWQEFGEAN